MSAKPDRPISPHLTGGGLMPHYRWEPQMAVSIFHRLTGDALGIGGVLALVLWLAAAASGKESYDWFISWASWWPFKVMLILLTWSFFQHLCSGLRHFVMDAGAGYEMKSNRTWSVGVFLIAFFLTAAFWLAIFWKAL